MPHEYLTYENELKFWSKVDLLSLDGHWNWKKYCDPKGYGRFYLGKLKYEDAHIVSWKISHPEYESVRYYKSIDHTCRNTSCVNPLHLDETTHIENVMRGVGWGATNARKTHCHRGHEFTKENTKIESSGSRRCRACMKMRRR